MLQAELGYRSRIGSFQPDLVVYAERVQNLITDGALRLPANPGQTVDPATGQYVIGFTGFENEPGSYFGLGAEVGGKWSPADGVDLGINYSYEKMFACRANGQSGCTDDISAANQVSATLGNTAEHKLNATALWRTHANIDLALDAHYVSGVAWFEKSFDVNREGGVVFTPYALPAYTMLNGRVGYRFLDDKLETSVAFYNLLGDQHREHPFGNEIGRRILFTAAGASDEDLTSTLQRLLCAALLFAPRARTRRRARPRPARLRRRALPAPGVIQGRARATAGPRAATPSAPLRHRGASPAGRQRHFRRGGMARVSRGALFGGSLPRRPSGLLGASSPSPRSVGAQLSDPRAFIDARPMIRSLLRLRPPPRAGDRGRPWRIGPDGQPRLVAVDVAPGQAVSGAPAWRF